MPKLLISRDLVLDANGQTVDTVGGSMLMFDSSGATVSIDVTWLDAGGNEAGTVKGVILGRMLRPGGEFASYRITGGNPNDTLRMLVGPLDSYTRESAQNVVIGHVIVDNEIEVKNDAGNPLVVSGEVTTAPNGNSISEPAAVAVTDVLTALLGADATALSVRLYNQGPDPVAIGGAGLTWAKRAVVLGVGDALLEEVAARLALSAICDAGNTAIVGIQVVKS